MKTIKQQFENDRRTMPVNECKNIKIIRTAEGGYQRKINMKRVRDIMEDLQKTGHSTYSEVLIANVNGQLQCVNGQHRLLGHIAAGVDCPVHIRSMTQDQAIDLFCRDNGKMKPLRRGELIAASRTLAAKTIRKLAKDYQAGIPQITNLMIGLKGGKLGDLHNHSNGFEDPEVRAATVILDIWAADTRFRKLDRIEDIASWNEYKNKIESAFSSNNTMWCLGAICKEYLSSINKTKAAVKALAALDWGKKGDRTLRGLQMLNKRTDLLELMRRSVEHE